MKFTECVYSNSDWSDCDPKSLLKTKTVSLKEKSRNETADAAAKCPKERILTKDCLKESSTNNASEDSGFSFFENSLRGSLVMF